MRTADSIGKNTVVNHHRKVSYRVLDSIPGVSAGEQGNGTSFRPSTSADAGFVAFCSEAASVFLYGQGARP